MKRIILLFSLCFSLMAAQSFAQEICNNNLDDDGDGLIDCRDGDCPNKVCEICNNGIDDDNDGFIDCYDKECTIDAACDGFFIGKDAICDVKPDNFPPFQMKLKYKSNPKMSNHINRLVVGDVDNDGVPELVSVYRSDENDNAATQSVINIFQAPLAGTTLTLDNQINVKNDGLLMTYEDIAMADINRDGCAEIFVVSKNANSTGFKIAAYDCNKNKVWANPISFSFDPGVMGLADFDGDGKVELYTRTQIYDAHTGVLMGSKNIDDDDPANNKGWGMNSNGPVAVDILDASPGLELVAGCRIYAVTISRSGTPTATLSLVKSRPEYFTRTGRTHSSTTSVADFNQDGHLDVLAVGSKDAYDANTTIFFWDVYNNTLKTYIDLSGTGDYKNGWKNGAGRVNIADVDGDNQQNAVFVSGRYLYALKETPTKLDTLWRRRVTEETSGITGCTMFDFNADGKSEIVYRDEDYLYIYTTTNINGVVTVTRSTPVRCSSRTSNEYPIVADIDGDGSTEICVTCSTTNTTNGARLDIYDEAEIRVYQSANEPWVPARRVWNQHGYFVVNVNDDLSIPLRQQLHHLIYANDAPCRAGGPSRPLNSFLNQSPYLNSKGCPSYAAPDVAIVDDPKHPFKVNPPKCPEKNFSVSFKFTNVGDISLTGNLPITFYSGDPTKVGALKLGTTMINLAKMMPGDTTIVTDAPITGTGGPFTLYVVLNDAGTTVPTPIKLPNSGFLECDYSNNILSAEVVPLPVDVIAEKLKDNISCSVSTTANGSARAYVQEATGKNTTDYTFYWTAGTVAKPVPAEKQGSTVTQLGTGPYVVFAIHKTVGCSSNVAQVDIPGVQNTITPQINIVSHLTKCGDEPNGHLVANVLDSDGNPVSTTVRDNNYTFVWYEGNNIFGTIVAKSPEVSGLVAKTYTVLVTEKTTGCFAPATTTIEDRTVKPVAIAAAKSIACSTTATGEVSATVDGITAGYTFAWYKGKAVKPTSDFTGDTWTGTSVTAGWYTVVATNTTSTCSSAPVSVQITQTTPPTVSVTKDSDQVSCDGTTPLGAATANVTGNVSDYTFQWYTQTTSSPIAGATNPSITGLAGSKTYIVRVTDKVTKCMAADKLVINNSTPPIQITINAANNTSCVPYNGRIEVTTFSTGTAADYTFRWINLATNAVLPETGNVLAGLEPGQYSVKATHKVRKCDSDVQTVTILANQPTLTITKTGEVQPSDCTSDTGSISVEASSSATNVNGFDFRWFYGSTSGTAVPAHAADAVTANTSRKEGLKQNYYTVAITDRDNGCSTDAQYYLQYINSHRLALIDQEDITNCVPGTGGSVTVELQNIYPGLTSAEYDVFLFQAAEDPMSTTGPIVPDNGTANQFQTIAALSPDYYTLVAVIKPTSSIPALAGCRASITTPIKKVTSNPVINANATNATRTDNSYCNVASTNTANGALALSVGGNPANYSYAWSNGATTRNLTDLHPGQYTVRVTYTTPVNQGCFADETFTILNNEDNLTVDAAAGDLTTTAVTHCDTDGYTPMTEGSAQFVRITNSASASPITQPFNGYTFSWFKEDGSAVPNDGNGQDWNMNNTLATGQYYVTAKSTTSSCDVTTDFTIEDQTINTLEVTLESFRNETRCIGAESGMLKVATTGTSLNGYTYRWTDSNNVVRGTTATLDNIVNLVPNEIFTVRVINNDSKCWVVDNYTLGQKLNPTQITASSGHVTNCFNTELGRVENGSLTTSVTFAGYASNGTLNPVVQTDYNYYWTVDGAPYSDQSIVENIPLADVANKEIKIKAALKSDAACESPELTLVIMDQRMYPPVIAQAIAPATNCDLTKPNGRASASVEGDIFNYYFDWFEGVPAAPVTPPGFYRGSEVSDLKAHLSPDFVIYTALATNIQNGCTSTDTTRVGFKPVAIQAPTIEILSQITSCIENNGMLTASVNGNAIDYIFDWFDGKVEKATPDFSGQVYDSLATGFYTVVATSRATGCKTPIDTEELRFSPIYPEFDLSITATTCTVPVDGVSAHASGILQFTLTNDVEAASVQWFRGAVTLEQVKAGAVTPMVDLNGPQADQLEAGTYTVVVTSMMGCAAEKIVEVPTEIRVFNGISRNNDGKNDIFNIGCIENYPDNLVKIFNRAGTLVYEANGYNNLDIFFDGKSNRGISMMGTDLPDGTYFYIVDKRDGSKPQAGYLEIVN